MKKNFLTALVLAGAFLFAFCFPETARAQFTTVTATVTDPNGIPYAGAVMNAILVPSTGGGYTLSGQPYSGRVGPVTLDSTGKFTVNFGDVTLITPGSPQWQITIDSASATIQGPLGTGPQTFVYTSTGTTISGSSPVSLTTALNALAPKLTNFVTAAGVTSVTATGPVIVTPTPITGTGVISCPTCNTSVPAQTGSGGFLLSTNCQGITTYCFQVHADGQIVSDPVFTASSGTVTSATANFCGGSGPACTAAQIARGHSTDVGTIEVGISTCNSINELACSTYNCTQGTITAVASATSVTVSPVCSANSSATAHSNFFYWGQDDGTQIAAANLALRTAVQTQSSTLELPCGIMLTSLPPFNNAGVTLNGFFNVGYQGCGPGVPSVVIPLPKMNCNSTALNGCLLSLPFSQQTLGDLGATDKARDIEFFAGGIPDKDAAATYSNPAYGITGGQWANFDDVWVQGWDWARASATPVYGWYTQGSTLVGSGSYVGGNFPYGCTSLGSVTGSVTGGSFGGSEWDSLTLPVSSPALGCDFFGVDINGPNGTTFNNHLLYGIYNNGSAATFHGGVIQAGAWTDSGTLSFFGTKIYGNSNYDINLAGGKNTFSAVTFEDNVNVAGGTWIDQCGNNTPPTGVIFTSGIIVNCGASAISSTTAVTSTNPTINTDQNLIQLSLPAGYFNFPTRAAYIEGSGIYSTTAASSPALTFEAKLCTVSGCGSGTVVDLFDITTTALNAAALTNATWNLTGTCVVNTAGATGNLVCHGKPGLTIDAGASLAVADSVFADTNTATLANIDLTAALFLQFTVAQSVAGASNSYTQQLANIR